MVRHPTLDHGIIRTDRTLSNPYRTGYLGLDVVVEVSLAFFVLVFYLIISDTINDLP